jgi:hypothetical protein
MMIPALALVLGCSADSIVGSAEHPASAAAVSEPNYSFSISPANRTVNVRFARVRSDGGESVSAFMQRVFASADAAGATRLVLDLSATKGGDSFLSVPLLKGLLAREQFTKRGGLVVIVGPDSFSAAQSVATLLQRYAQPVFVSRPVS